MNIQTKAINSHAAKRRGQAMAPALCPQPAHAVLVVKMSGGAGARGFTAGQAVSSFSDVGHHAASDPDPLS